MKQASLLIILCALISLTAVAQTTTIEKNAKRITITTTKIDENGQEVTETWIAEGEQPEKILENMAVNPDVLQKINIEQGNQEKGERLFLFRSAGDKAAIEGILNENVQSKSNIEDTNGEIETIIIIDDSKNAESGRLFEKVHQYHDGLSYAKVWSHGFDGKSNCAALGVYVNHDGDEGGTRINSVINKSGAQEAGLKEGDMINKIEEFDISDFPSLHLALSHFQPGDVVTVRYVRGEKNQKARVELKDWAQLPGHEWRARSDCGPDPVTEDKPVDKVLQDGPAGSPNIQPLDLQDPIIFPNPTDGVFAFSFRSDPGPIAISITDVNGKVVYHENNDNTSGSYNRDIDLKGLPQGNYIISVNQGEKVFTEQISKQ